MLWKDLDINEVDINEFDISKEYFDFLIILIFRGFMVLFVVIYWGILW